MGKLTARIQLINNPEYYGMFFEIGNLTLYSYDDLFVSSVHTFSTVVTSTRASSKFLWSEEYIACFKNVVIKISTFLKKLLFLT